VTKPGAKDVWLMFTLRLSSSPMVNMYTVYPSIDIQYMVTLAIPHIALFNFVCCASSET
jgi:hypothetical protein